MSRRSWADPFAIRIGAAARVVQFLGGAIAAGVFGIAAVIGTRVFDGRLTAAVLSTGALGMLALAVASWATWRYRQRTHALAVDARGALTLDGEAATILPSTWWSGNIIGLALARSGRPTCVVLIAPGAAPELELRRLRTYLRWTLSRNASASMGDNAGRADTGPAEATAQSNETLVNASQRLRQ